MNELYIICILTISILSLYFTNKYLKSLGLKITFLVFNILSFILSFKYLILSTLNFNSNAITYTTMFSCLCLLLESSNKNTKKDINKIINLGFILNIFSAIMLYIMSYYTQSLNDTIGINMTNTFINNYKTLIFYPLSILISQKLLILIYSKIKNIYDNIFISMVTTYLAVGLIESITYMFLTYYNVLESTTIIKLLLSTYMIRIIVIVIYSLFLTIFNKKKVQKWVI